MNIQDIYEIISNLGFPMTMVGYFIYDKYKTMQPVLEAIQQNTIVLNKLLVKMGKEDLLGGESHE